MTISSTGQKPAILQNQDNHSTAQKFNQAQVQNNDEWHLVHEEKYVADFNTPEFKALQKGGNTHTEALDHLRILRNEKGEYAYQIIYNPNPDPLMMVDEPLEGAITPITNETQEGKYKVLSTRIQDVNIPVNGNKASYMSDVTPDEMVIRIKKQNVGSTILSLYSNVNDGPDCNDDFDYLQRVLKNYGPEGTRSVKPNLNGDPKSESLEPGDNSNQISVIYFRDPI